MGSARLEGVGVQAGRKQCRLLAIPAPDEKLHPTSRWSESLYQIRITQSGPRADHLQIACVRLLSSLRPTEPGV